MKPITPEKRYPISLPVEFFEDVDSGESGMRVFYAIEPDLDSRQRLDVLFQLVKPQLSSCGRLTDIASIHLTLLFVGEWPVEKIGLLERLLDDIAALATPFSITFDQFGYFDHRRKDRRGKPDPLILWLGHSPIDTGRPTADPDLRALIALVDRLRQSTQALGLSAETRPFTPHLTLTRQMPADQAKAILASLPSFEPICFQVNRITLMQSIPAAGKMRYEPVKRAQLSGKGG